MADVRLAMTAHDEEQPAEKRGKLRTLPWLMAAAAAAIAVMLILPIVQRDRSPVARLVELAPHSARVVEPRLTGGFAWAAYRGPVRSSGASRDGRLWVGTFSGGLSVFDPRTETFTRHGYGRVRGLGRGSGGAHLDRHVGGTGPARSEHAARGAFPLRRPRARPARRSPRHAVGRHAGRLAALATWGRGLRVTIRARATPPGRRGRAARARGPRRSTARESGSCADAPSAVIRIIEPPFCRSLPLIAPSAIGDDSRSSDSRMAAFGA